MWHVKYKTGKVEGPFATEELAEMYITGVIDDADELWSKESGVWAKAWQCKGMFLSIEEGSNSEDNVDSVSSPLSGEEEDLNYLDEIGMGVSGVEGDYVCPFCWRKFDLADVKFIAQHLDLVGDDVLWFSTVVLDRAIQELLNCSGTRRLSEDHETHGAA